MNLLETARFAHSRKRIRGEDERLALKEAVLAIKDNPALGKKLRGELGDLRSYAYTVRGQARRLVYRWEKKAIILYSFGPRQGIYK